MVEVTAWRREDSEPIEPKLAEVDPVPLRRVGQLRRGQDLGVTAPEDELAGCECAARIDASTP